MEGGTMEGEPCRQELLQKNHGKWNHEEEKHGDGPTERGTAEGGTTEKEGRRENRAARNQRLDFSSSVEKKQKRSEQLLARCEGK